MAYHLMWAQKDEREKSWRCELNALYSKESYDPLTVKLDRWSKAKSLHSIMTEHKMIEMEGRLLSVKMENKYENWHIKKDSTLKTLLMFNHVFPEQRRVLPAH